MSSDDNFGSEDALLAGAMVGAVVAVLGTVLWYGGVGRAPGRMAFAVCGSLGRLRRGFTAGVALVAILATPVLLGVAITIFIGSYSYGRASSFTEIRDFVLGLMVAVALACVVGFAVAAHNWLMRYRSVRRRPARSAQPVPGVAAQRTGLTQRTKSG